MKLKLEKVQQITLGAVQIKEENGRFSFHRFTAEQENLYQIANEDFYNKTKATSGVKLSFKTDSQNLFIKVQTSPASSRTYFSVDVFVNGEPLGYIDNFSGVNLERDYTGQAFPLGEFSRKFPLGEGEKTVLVHLPWSVKTEIEEISVDDAAYVEGIKPQKKLIAFGDSITHGYDALRPSNRYVAKLAERLEAEEFNKGIGAERFFPPLATLKDPISPDYITVAYGTNDWSTIDAATFRVNCKAFYENLSKKYPDAKIFAITPIWRKDHKEGKNFGPFETVEKYIREAVSEFQNVTVLSGFDLIPHDVRFFADYGLHPNEEGFALLAKNVYTILEQKRQGSRNRI